MVLRTARRLVEAKSEGGDVDRHQRPHWRKGHLKSQPHGPKLSLRKIIWIQPYCTGKSGGENCCLNLCADLAHRLT
jgi:hypothetical protein